MNVSRNLRLGFAMCAAATCFAACGCGPTVTTTEVKTSRQETPPEMTSPGEMESQGEMVSPGEMVVE